MTHNDIIAFCRQYGLQPHDVDIRTDGDGQILDICVSFEEDIGFKMVTQELIPNMGEN